MSYTLCAWQSPLADALPADRAAADAQLAEQRARGHTGAKSPFFLGLAEALYERFPPTEDQGENGVWTDSSEDGQTDEAVFSFGLQTKRFFESAYLHAVAQARRLGLNLYDPQSGDHFLADGRGLLGDGRTEAARSLEDDLWEAEVAWRRSDWTTALGDWRQAIARGSAHAMHDYGRVLRLGLGGPPWHQLGTALMILAAVDQPSFEQDRSTAYRSLAPGLQRELPEMLARLRAAPELLPAIDAELGWEKTRREAIAPWPWDPRGWSPERLTALWRLAADGMAEAAERLAQALETNPQQVAELGGPEPDHAPGMAAQLRLLAAEAGAPEAQVQVAQRLLAGEAGWALDPAGALLWLRRAQMTGRPGLEAAVAQLGQRLAQGWNATADRDSARAAMPGPPDQTAHSRMARLRRACELDLPEAWREMGQAYTAGIQGLPRHPVVGTALILFSHKQLCTSSQALPAWVRAQLPPVHAQVLDEALALSRRLVGASDPWALIQEASQTSAELPSPSHWLDSTPPWATTSPHPAPPTGEPVAPTAAALPRAASDGLLGSGHPAIGTPGAGAPSTARPAGQALPPQQTLGADDRASASRSGFASTRGGPQSGFHSGHQSGLSSGFHSQHPSELGRGNTGQPGRSPALVHMPANLALPPSRHTQRTTAAPPPKRAAAPSAPPSLPGSLALLWLGTAGAVLWLAYTGQPGPGGRLALVMLGACAATGAWGCATHLDQALWRRLLTAASAAVPLLGLVPAGLLSLALWRRRG